MVRTIFDQSAAEQVRTQHAWIIEALEAKYPAAAGHSEAVLGRNGLSRLSAGGVVAGLVGRPSRAVEQVGK